MKKILSAVLAVAMTASLAISASASFQANNTDVSKIKYTIPQGYAEHKLDGVITDGEYDEIHFSTDELSFAAYDDASIEASVANKISLYMSYDANYVYVAATTIAAGFHNECDDNMGNIWGQYAVQLSFADVDNDDAAARLETGYALSSATGNLLGTTWNDGQGIGYDALANGDFTVVNNGDAIVYEIRVPYSAFTEKTLKEGDSLRFSIVWATGTSEADAVDQYIHEQLAYGITGDPGKDVTGHATITLGAALEAPVAETTAAADTAAVADNTTSAPTTADAGIVAAVAVMAVAAGFVVSKKH